jgi:hypothetical protein
MGPEGVKGVFRSFAIVQLCGIQQPAVWAAARTERFWAGAPPGLYC